MKNYKVTLIPGDGIGPEVVKAAVKVLDSVTRKLGTFQIEYEEVLAGGAAIDVYGKPLPEETLNKAKSSDAVLLGAVGGYKWDKLPGELRPEKALLGLRKELGLFANLRPAILYKELSSACPLKDCEQMDILIVRELTGGMYFGKRGRFVDEVLGDSAYDTECYSVMEIERIIREAFRYAMGRRKKLTLVDKANVLESSRLWREVLESIKPEYPEVEVDYLYIDNATMQLIARPSSFDVIVTSNMFGDILSDEAGQITGSIGMLPSASLGIPGTPGMYEPVHGSAPDIVGQDKANPLATILSVAMMLKWSFGEEEASQMIENAVTKVLQDSYKTCDIAYSESDKIVGTAEMADLVIARL